MNNDQTSNREKLKEMVKDIKIAMMFTHSPDSGFSGRPMFTADVAENGGIWFFTNEFSAKVDDIQQDHEVVLSYASQSSNLYVVIKGRAKVSTDQEIIKRLWNPSMKAWFPEGLDDPKIALLEITPEEAEYWNGNASKLVVGFKMLKAMVTGEPYRDGDHAKININ